MLVSLDDRRSDPDADPDLPTPVALTPLGPRDGKASIGLPVSAEPNVGLEDGTAITASGSGFQPGEGVAIVQCALEAGRPAKGGEAAGVDGCDIEGYTSLTATSDGVASGTYLVRQHLTTPVTGTVDCGSEPGRCIIAMAAISDYDRSGGAALNFGEVEGPGPVPPMVIVEPSVGLTDAQVVQVTATGLTPATGLRLEVCSDDPAACWSTAVPSDPTAALVTDADGGLSVQVPVWRYLPGPEPRTYVDCAVSVCNLWLTPEAGGDPAAGPPRLPVGWRRADRPSAGGRARRRDRPGGGGPGAGSRVRAPGPRSSSRCASDRSARPIRRVCAWSSGGPSTSTVTAPWTRRPRCRASARLDGYEPSGSTTTAGASADPSAPPVGEVGAWPCDGISSRCVIRGVPGYGDGPGPLRPRFGPDPVPITYRRPA